MLFYDIINYDYFISMGFSLRCRLRGDGSETEES